MTDCQSKNCRHLHEKDCIQSLELKVYALTNQEEKARAKLYFTKIELREAKEAKEIALQKNQRLLGKIAVLESTNSELHKNIDAHFSARQMSENQVKDLQTELQLLRLEKNGH